MTTPMSTASAWHRRRNVLSMTTPHPQAPIASSDSTIPSTTSRPASMSTRPPSASLFRPPPPTSTFSAPTFSITSLLPASWSRSLLRAFMLTALAIVLSRGTLSIFRPFLRLLYPCTPQPPPTQWAVTFVKMTFFFPGLLFVTLTFCITVSHLRKLALHTQSARNRFIAAIFPVVVTIPGTVALSYLLYGPTVAPFRQCWLVEPSIFPTWRYLFPQLLHAACAAAIGGVMTHAMRLRSQLYHPFKAAFVPKIRPLIPTLASILLVSNALAFIPATFTSMLVIGEASNFVSFSIITPLSALVVTLSMQAVWLIDIVIAEVTTLKHNTNVGVGVGVERANMQDLLSFLHSLTTPLRPIQVQTEHVPAFTKLLRDALLFDSDVSTFDFYLDSTAHTWRVALAYTLYPLQSAIDRIDANLRNSPNYPHLLRGSSKSVFGVHTIFMEMFRSGELFSCEEMLSISNACVSLSSVFVNAVQSDTYGVVHRSLPEALMVLLNLKQSCGQFRDASARANQSGIYEGRKKDIQFVRAIDDAIVTCVYQIVDVYRGYLTGFIGGKEIAWDSRLDGALMQFLQYQVA